MSSYSLDAIILKTINLAEADKLVTVFSKEFGKRTFIAKGARKIKSKKSPYIDLGSVNKCIAVETKGIHLLTEISNLYFPERIYGDLEKTTSLCICLEATEKLFKEDEDHEYIFNILFETVKGINTTDSTNAVPVYLEKILHHAGFIGELNNCPVCSRDFRESDEFYLSLKDGSLTHGECCEQKELALKVEKDELKVLKFWQKASIEKSNRILVPKDISENLTKIIDYYWDINVGCDIKSKRSI